MLSSKSWGKGSFGGRRGWLRRGRGRRGMGVNRGRIGRRRVGGEGRVVGVIIGFAVGKRGGGEVVMSRGGGRIDGRKGRSGGRGGGTPGVGRIAGLRGRTKPSIFF